jgi:hypothetical protein
MGGGSGCGGALGAEDEDYGIKIEVVEDDAGIERTT